MNRRIVGLVAAAAISHLGTGMTMLAIPWFVLHSTGRGTDVGFVVMAETGGVLAGSMFGGPWVDRLRPRRAAVVFDLVAAVVVLAIPLLHRGNLLPLWSLAVLAAVLGLSRAPGDAARQVLVPEIARRDGLPVERVTTAYDGPAQGARALGAPLAGAVIAVLGAPSALVLDAGSFVVSAAVTRFTLDEVRLTPVRGRGYAGQLVDGFRFLLGDRTLVAIMLMVAVTNGLNSGFFSVLVPAYGARVLHSPIAVGAIFAASGVALILGSLMFSWIGLGWPRLRVLAICYPLVLGPRMVLFLLTSDEVALIALSGLLMLAFGPLNPILGAVKAERIPAALRARILGAITAVAMACMPVGVLLAGVLLDGVGLPATIAAFGVVSTVMSLCPVVFPAWRGVAGGRRARTNRRRRSGVVCSLYYFSIERNQSYVAPRNHTAYERRKPTRHGHTKADRQTETSSRRRATRGTPATGRVRSGVT